MLRLALDTNVLAYAEGVNGPERQEHARRLIQRLPSDIVVVPVQALGELFHVLVRKAGRSRADESIGGVFYRLADELEDHRVSHVCGPL